MNDGNCLVLDHLDYKNKQALSDWEERLWQSQRCSHFHDPRDDFGLQQYREHLRRIGELRDFARCLYRDRCQSV